MAREDPIQKLSRLTERQLEILRLRCEGLEILPISEMLIETEWVVKQEIGRIYIKLGLDKHTKIQRYKALFEEYCPAVEEADLPPPEPERAEPELIPEEVERMVEEDEREIVSRGQKPLVSITVKDASPRRRPTQCLLVGLALSALSVGCAVCCAVAVFLWPVVKRGILAEATPATAISQDTPTPVIRTEVPTREATQEVPVDATATPTPVLVSTVPFFDDFDDALDPAWQVVSGDVAIVNGRLTTSNGVTLWVGGSAWKDYTVEFESWPNGSWDSDAISVRIQDIDNLVQFSWSCRDYSRWTILRDGAQQQVPNTRGPSFGFHHGGESVKVIVAGNEYRAYLRGSKVSSFIDIDERFPSGRVGITLLAGSQIDNFRVTPLEE
jgi:DNA-binding CsgD family transcriptional regulator